jgi:hypothetical protein
MHANTTCRDPRRARLSAFSLFVMGVGLVAPGDAYAAETPAASPSPASSDSELDMIVVRGHAMLRDTKPYRSFIDAMASFEKNQSLAPNSVLRFTVMPWHDKEVLHGLTLRLVGKTIERDIPVAADGSFSLELDDRAAGDKAKLISNKPVGTLVWRTNVRTPGLAANTRRLGDLRLECEVEFAANIAPYVWGNYSATPAQACHDSFYGKSWFADVPVFAVTLVDGTRREVLPARSVWGFHLPVRSVPYADHRDGELSMLTDWHDYMRERLFTVPIEETTWSDDTLVVLDPGGDSIADRLTTAPSKALLRKVDVFTPQIAAQLFVPGETTRDEVKHILGSGTSIQFSSGDEAWVYEYYQGSTWGTPKWQDSEAREDRTMPQRDQRFVAEIRVLFDDRGILQKRLFITTKTTQHACWATPQTCFVRPHSIR